jgi:hypothetical protein
MNMMQEFDVNQDWKKPCATGFNSQHSLWNSNRRDPAECWTEVKDFIEIGYLMNEPSTPM